MAYSQNPWSLKDITDHARLLSWFQNMESGIAAAASAATPVFVNVKDFGATGDGNTDDAAAIQAAINSIPTVPDFARGGTVWFPPGTYRIGTTLTLPLTIHNSAYKAITLAGPGMEQADIRRAAGFNGILIDASGSITGGNVVTRRVFFHLRDITLHGFNGASSGSLPLVRAYYLTLSRFERVHFNSNLGPAVEGVEFQDSRFYDCWFDWCNGATSSDLNGTVTGLESVRMISKKEGAASGTFGFSTDSCNNIGFVNNLFTSGNTNWSGYVVISQNGGSNIPHRIYFVNNKMEGDPAGGSPVKLWNCQLVRFENADFSGYTAGPSPISYIDAINAKWCSIRNAFWDDSQHANVTHAPIKMQGCTYWTLEDVATNIGTAAGGDTNAAGLVDFSPGGNDQIYLNNHSLNGRTSPKFAGTLPTNFYGPLRGALFTSTPGAVTTLTIAHGLGYAPTVANVDRADVNARGAPAYHVTADGTNLTLNFASALTAATAYSWRWLAS